MSTVLGNDLLDKRDVSIKATRATRQITWVKLSRDAVIGGRIEAVVDAIDSTNSFVVPRPSFLCDIDSQIHQRR